MAKIIKKSSIFDQKLRFLTKLPILKLFEKSCRYDGAKKSKIFNFSKKLQKWSNILAPKMSNFAIFDKNEIFWIKVQVHGGILNKNFRKIQKMQKITKIFDFFQKFWKFSIIFEISQPPKRENCKFLKFLNFTIKNFLKIIWNFLKNF